MKVLVTGSAGFIGTHLIKSLHDSGINVIGLDKAHEPHQEKDEIPCYACNILDHEKLLDVFTKEQPTAVVHLAARTDLEEHDDLNGYASNIQGVQNIVDCIEKTQSVTRSIITSSQLVCDVSYMPKHDQDFNPSTLYGQSKVETEKIIRDCDGGKKTWTLVRPTTIWGPGVSTHYQRFFKYLQKGYYFYVTHDPLWKSYGYVGNTIFQIIQILNAPETSIHQRVFYLADYKPISLQNWCNQFQKELNGPRIPVFPQIFATFLAKTGDLLSGLGWKFFPFTSFRLKNILTQYVFDLKPTELICGELPYSWEDGVTKTVQWLSDAKIVQSHIKEK
ncbi:MAG: NAD(P)-dependent oxidoreductase [Myxococcota bacterium]|jgi:nucleoside-diphosphate-sugar epimerase|nr:NAD(P)-dependent oxidoreductase [Myxococcota bacterium]